MKNLAILIVACGVVVGAGHYALLQPKQLQNARQERSWHELQNKVNEARAAFKARPLFREEVGRLELEAGRWLTAAPADGGIPELLAHLRQVGMAKGVTPERRPSPGGEEPGDAARITVRGSRRQVKSFFGALSGDVYPFVAGDLELFPVEGTADAFQADLTVSPSPGRP